MAQGRPWVDVYPTENLIHGSSEEGALLVDVGGNVGQGLDQFLVRHPDQAARLVLQDLPTVVEKAGCDPSIERIAYDFFTPQPVKGNTHPSPPFLQDAACSFSLKITGARAYYVHGIIHDWSDEHSREILTNIKNAMEPGYSKLLINEFVMPSFQPPSRAAGLDLQMMVKVASRERTADTFKELLESAGLQVVQVCEHPESFPSIVEAALLEQVRRW